MSSASRLSPTAIVIALALLSCLTVGCASSPGESATGVCAPPPPQEYLELAKTLLPSEPLPKGDAVRGGELFVVECDRCHGASAPPDRGYPALDCDEFLGAATHEYLFAVVAEGGKPFAKRTIMRPFAKRLGAQAVADIVAYLEAQSSASRRSDRDRR